MIEELRDSLSFFLPVDVGNSIKGLLAEIEKDAAIKKLAQATIPSISWNHAKVVAVDGRTSMTGGGIFLWPYTDGHSEVSDLQSKVKGEVAISTHSYCDYFWQYVALKILFLKAYQPLIDI